MSAGRIFLNQLVILGSAETLLPVWFANFLKHQYSINIWLPIRKSGSDSVTICTNPHSHRARVQDPLLCGDRERRDAEGCQAVGCRVQGAAASRELNVIVRRWRERADGDRRARQRLDPRQRNGVGAVPGRAWCNRMSPSSDDVGQPHQVIPGITDREDLRRLRTCEGEAEPDEPPKDYYTRHQRHQDRHRAHRGRAER